MKNHLHQIFQRIECKQAVVGVGVGVSGDERKNNSYNNNQTLFITCEKQLLKIERDCCKKKERKKKKNGLKKI